MTLREYLARLSVAGPSAREADGLLTSLESELDLRREYGQGSLKLYGYGGSSILFQPAIPSKKDFPGLRVQTRDHISRERADLVRRAVKRVGGDPHPTFSFISTDLLVSRWSEIRREVLVPYLSEWRQ